MCFHCENGRPEHHIPTEYRRVATYQISGGGELFKCLHCLKNLMEEQAFGKSPHWCGDRYVMISNIRPHQQEISLNRLSVTYDGRPVTIAVAPNGEIKFFLKGK